MPVIDPLPEEALDERIEALDERMRQYTSAPGMTPYVNAAAWYPPLLERLAEEHLTVMPSDELRRETKEVMAVAVSMVNDCTYCIEAHTTLLRETFGRTDRDVVEIAAAAAHGTGLARMERALGEGTPFDPVRIEGGSGIAADEDSGDAADSEAALFEGFQAVEIFQANNVWTAGLQLERGPWGRDGDGAED